MHDDFTPIFRNLHLKATPKRLALLDILRKETVYLSPEEIWEKMKGQFRKIGLPTVYRILDELSAGKVISKITHPNRQLYYFFCKNESYHHHFVCLGCRNVQDFEFCSIGELEHKVRKALKGQVTSHILQVNGFCRGCLKKQKI